jgi:hypothetical protein
MVLPTSQRNSTCRISRFHERQINLKQSSARPAVL